MSKSIYYGDYIQLIDANYGTMGTYDKTPVYVVFGRGDATLSVGQSTIWKILQNNYNIANSNDIKYGDSFYLFNVDFEQWVSDDNSTKGFNGVSGYFGLSTSQKSATKFRFLGNKGNIYDKDSEITICVDGGARADNTLTVYDKNGAEYFVWDSPTYPSPKLMIVKK